MSKKRRRRNRELPPPTPRRKLPPPPPDTGGPESVLYPVSEWERSHPDRTNPPNLVLDNPS